MLVFVSDHQETQSAFENPFLIEYKSFVLIDAHSVVNLKCTYVLLGLGGFLGAVLFCSLLKISMLFLAGFRSRSRDPAVQNRQ